MLKSILLQSWYTVSGPLLVNQVEKRWKRANKTGRILQRAARPRENRKGLLTVYNLNWRRGVEFLTLHSVNQAPHIAAFIRKEDNKKGGLIHRIDFLMHKNKPTRTRERGVGPCHNHKGLLSAASPQSWGDGDVDALPGKSAPQIIFFLRKERKRERKANP